MLLDTDRDKDIDLKKCLFSDGHILLSDSEFKGEVPAASGSNTPLGRSVWVKLALEFGLVTIVTIIRINLAIYSPRRKVFRRGKKTNGVPSFDYTRPNRLMIRLFMNLYSIRV